MEIIIRGEIKEIAALVLAVQERQDEELAQKINREILDQIESRQTSQ